MPRVFLASACLLIAGCGACEEDETPAGNMVRKISAAEELIGGVAAGGRIGDYLIDNGRVRFIIEDPNSARGWGLHGGSLIDLDRTPSKDAPRPGDDRLQEIFFQCNLRGFDPERAEIVSDGADGTGILRLIGRDKGIPLIDAVAKTKDLQLTITVDFILPKDSDSLEIHLTVKDERKIEPRDMACGVVLLRGDEYQLFLEGNGWGLAGGAINWAAAAEDNSGTSFALHNKTGDLNVIIPINEVLPLAAETRQLLANGTYEDRYFLSIGTGDVESALTEMRRVRGDVEPRQAVSIAIKAPDFLKAEIQRAVITIVNADLGDRPLTAIRPGADDVARVTLPQGNYRALVDLHGQRIDLQSFTVMNGPVDLETNVPNAGVLSVKSLRVDRQGRVLGPTAAKLYLMRGHGAAATAERVLEQYLKPEDEVMIPAGDYTAYLSRGPEYELAMHDVTVPSLGRTHIEAKIQHSVDTSGWVAADLHVHSTKSVDADERLETRVLGAIAEGLEILVSTDHDVVTDYNPIIEKLGVTELLRTETGIEISPLHGHINAWPIAAERPEKYWGVEWFKYDELGQWQRMLEAHEIVAIAREKGAEIVQINHPREGSAFFDHIVLDPMTATSELPFPSADAFELLNGKRQDNFDVTLRDLVGLARNNKRMTGTGTSDAHGRGSRVGYARTLIKSNADDPTELDLPQIWAALRSGQVLALTGPFVRFEARKADQRAGVGETLAGGGPIQLWVQVQAPSWMTVDRLRILADGETMIDRAITPADASPQDPVIRLETTFTATPAKDAFYLTIVEGAGPNAPVIDAEVRTASNPVFVDVDGGGFSYRP